MIDRFNEAMDDDFNTSIAISLIFELAKTSDKNVINWFTLVQLI
jgi:cysteinyl-tRNA synthetase